jgi:hypothetical protein
MRKANGQRHNYVTHNITLLIGAEIENISHKVATIKFSDLVPLFTKGGNGAF